MGVPTLKRSPLRRVAMKRKPARGAAAWAKRKAAHLAVRPDCALRYRVFWAPVPLDYPDRCWGPIGVHHIMPRGMGGVREDDSPLVTVCRRHHQYIEEHRAWARRVGLLLKRRNDAPAAGE